MAGLGENPRKSKDGRKRRQMRPENEKAFKTDEKFTQLIRIKQPFLRAMFSLFFRRGAPGFPDVFLASRSSLVKNIIYRVYQNVKTISQLTINSPNGMPRMSGEIL